MNKADFRRFLQRQIESFDDDNPDRCDETVNVIREVERYAVSLGLPRVAEVCQSVTTPLLSLNTARVVLCECLSLIPTDSDLLTVKQAAEQLGVSANAVYDLVARGLLRHKRIGIGRGTIRIPKPDLDSYLRHAGPRGWRF